MINNLKPVSNFPFLKSVSFGKKDVDKVVTSPFGASDNSGTNEVKKDTFVKQAPPTAEPTEAKIAEPSNQEMLNGINSFLAEIQKPQVGTLSKGIESLKEAQLLDTFTGLGSKTSLFAAIDRTLEESKKTGDPFKLAMFDMDNFKSINELFNYEIGDLFILKMTKIIKDELEEHKIPAYRFGGDEFVILFDKENSNKSEVITKNILKKINSDKELRDYLPDYFKAAEEKIKECEEKQAPYVNIMNLKSDYEYNLKSMEEAEQEGYLQAEKFLKTKSDRLYSQWRDATVELLESSIDFASPDKRDFIEERIAHAKNSTPKDRGSFFTKELGNCLERFNKSKEIDVIKKWVHCARGLKNGELTGFTATCGLMEFQDFDKTSKSYVREVGKLLIKGKDADKDRIYKAKYIPDVGEV